MTIEVHYIAKSRLAQKGSFFVKWQTIWASGFRFLEADSKRNVYHAKLEKVILDGDKDITELVKELEKSVWRKIEDNWNLPF
ncbi:hypothetical protein [Bacillus sp. EB600]|uniref:hypothetical protein n=1 Tax=Bacillus sp. EB600 TaxID=2806345 RepID=UPI00210B40F0|nr:hypothetical protein [Bacillus sp. EB600]MCQ6282272.1 hypothetical protein [Bacillus sp. EB600]